jgi:hypothetical protein
MVEKEFFVIANPSDKARTYGLAKKYQRELG